ncbi:MAG: hypothetical protein WAN86_14705 [Hyphomicrobiaceae bacterium]
MSDKAATTPRYWIAINGSSCALSAIPWQNPVTIPRAQQLFGFPTLKEAKKAQHVCLTATIPEVRAFFESLRPDVASGRVVHLTPANPEPQTHGETMWMEEGPEDGITEAARLAYEETSGGGGPLPGLRGGQTLD